MKANVIAMEAAVRGRRIPLRLRSERAASVAALPRIIRIERRGPVLHRSSLSDSEDVLSLNLAGGCVHRCAYCFIRGYPSYPGDNQLQLYRRTAEQLDEELAARRHRPRAVVVSPATDPFPPLNEVQAEAARVAAVLTRHGVEAWFMTRGYIRPSALAVLEQHASSVRITFGLTTLDRDLQRLLEPLTAPPRLRLRQLAQCRKLGIKIQVALEPLVPGLTDTRPNVELLLRALADVGVSHVTAGYLFLRRGIRDHLQEVVEEIGNHQLLEAFAAGPVLQLDHAAPARYLPKAYRQHGYAALMALAATLGITVSVSKLTNPDFCAPRRAPTAPRLRQLTLPMF